MRPNARKNQKLIEQYPFIRYVRNASFGSAPIEHGDRVDDLSIKVQIADGDLMFAQARNVGLNGRSWIWSDSKAREGQVGQRREILFAIDHKQWLIDQLEWPNDEPGDLYGRAVLWGTDHGDGHYSNPLYDQVKYLVWVTIESWFEDTKDDDNRFGEFKYRSMKITIYGEPEQGFAELDRNASMEDHLRLSMSVLCRAAVERDFHIIKLSGQLDELCHRFQEEVYFNGMKEIADDPEWRICGSGRFGPVKVLVAEMCGYERVMLEDDSSWISFQLRSGASKMYVLGLGGKLPQARRLVTTVVDAWRQPESRTNFKHDRNVSVM